MTGENKSNCENSDWSWKHWQTVKSVIAKHRRALWSRKVSLETSCQAAEFSSQSECLCCSPSDSLSFIFNTVINLTVILSWGQEKKSSDSKAEIIKPKSSHCRKVAKINQNSVFWLFKSSELALASCCRLVVTVSKGSMHTRFNFLCVICSLFAVNMFLWFLRHRISFFDFFCCLCVWGCSLSAGTLLT